MLDVKTHERLWDKWLLEIAIFNDHNNKEINTTCLTREEIASLCAA